MFSLFTRSRKAEEGPAEYSVIKTDLHSHLLPGIDDGSPDLATSLELVKGLASLGYKKLITTPHIMWDIYRNTPAIIQEKLQLLQDAVKANGIPVQIEAAAEYFLDEHVESLLRKNEPLLPISGKMVLVEFSLAFPSHSLKDILFQMQMQGYQPIIAHPERYIYLAKAKDFYDELKDLGCLFQLNILSLSQHYGKSVQELGQYLIKKGYYDLVGTDLHHFRHLEALKHPSISAVLKKMMDSGKIRNAEL